MREYVTETVQIAKCPAGNLGSEEVYSSASKPSIYTNLTAEYRLNIKYMVSVQSNMP